MAATSVFVARLRSKCYAPDFSQGEGTAEEYFEVRVNVLLDRWERNYDDIIAAESDWRANAKVEYKDATNDLKWAHRQRQLQVRKDFDAQVAELHATMELAEAEDRQHIYDDAVLGYDEALKLADHRRGAKVKSQLALIRQAEADQQREAFDAEQRLNFADAVEVLLREQARGRGELEQAEHDYAFNALWIGGVWAAKVLKVSQYEARGRQKIAAREEWARAVDIRAMHLTIMVANGEAFYRAKIADYEEPRRRDAIEQRWLREKEFVMWQDKVRGLAMQETLVIPPSKRHQVKAIATV